jgi:predicted metal-dependent peptidase
MKALDKLMKARVQIQRRNSFFAYLSFFLKLKEVKIKDMPKWEDGGLGAGVDIRGNFYYTADFIEGMKDFEVEGVVVHEILHLALLHLARTGNRNPELFNICEDIVVNQILKDNNFQLPKGVLWTDNDNSIKLFEKTPYEQIIKDCNKKMAEEIFDEIKLPKMSGKGVGKGKGKKQKGKDNEEGEGFDLGKTGRFDEHFKSKDLSDKERKELEKEWLGKVQEAITISKMRGDIPVGLERLVERLHEEKISWKTILYQFITRQIPFDYSWASPSKKSIAVGTYMPDVLKEKVEVAIMLDLSGSIGQEELVDFMSEVVGIGRAFQERIDIRVFSHDTECYDCGLVRNGNIEQLKKLEIKGGGGTDFNKPVEYLKENNIKPKILIWLTDGYGTALEKQEFPILWVLSKNGSDDLIKEAGEVIKLDK